MPAYTPIHHDTIPTTPYSDAELLHFARHNLHFFTDGALVTKYAPTEQVERYAELVSKLPPAQQILTVGAHASGIVPATLADFELLMKRVNYQKSLPMGLFFHGEPIEGVGAAPIIWGGVYEQRPREHTVTNPDATFRHEHGHRIDKILGSDFVGVAIIDPSAHFISRDPEWSDAVTAQLANRAPAQFLSTAQRKKGVRFGWARPDEDLYPGSRTLERHLSYNYTPKEQPCEAFAEMSVHYTSLYDLYKGDEARIDRRLTQAYPVLWPLYRDRMLPLVETRAIEVLNRIEDIKHSTVQYASDTAHARGEPYDPHKTYAALRTVELEQGYAGLCEHNWESLNTCRAHTQPLKEYFDTIANLNSLRFDFGRISASSPERKARLHNVPRDASYKELLDWGIDIAPEIRLLRMEENRVEAFALRMRAWSGWSIASGPSQRWILEDFDYIKTRFTGRNAEGLEAIDTLLAIPQQLYIEYADALESIAPIYYGDADSRKGGAIPKRQQRGERADFYTTALEEGAQGIREKIEQMKALHGSERFYVGAKLAAYRRQGLSPAAALKAAHSEFRTIVRTQGKEAAIQDTVHMLITPTDTIEHGAHDGKISAAKGHRK